MSRFIPNDNNTVTDTQTGLVWSRNTIAQDVNHADAEKAVAALGEGWRLPTSQELFALVDHGRQEPAIDTEAFPDTARAWYWTGTPTAWNSSAVWVVGFNDGSVSLSLRANDACVRAVRAGQ